MNKFARICLQSFLLGLGCLSYFIIKCNIDYFIEGTNLVLFTQPCWFYVGYYFFINIFIKVCYYKDEWQVAVRGCFLGTVCGSGITIASISPSQYCAFGWYMAILSIFHVSEYLITALTNPKSLSLDSFLLNHSIAYGAAAVSSWLEFFLESWLCPAMKKLWYISVVGLVLCLMGEVFRKAAILTARTNFNHIVQTQKCDDHELVTKGVYRLFRHPSYFGWFWWSIGTQFVLINPICLLGYTLASWSFFRERIVFEEMTLINFFGEKYVDYQRKVKIGLPFIEGFKYEY